MTKLAVSIVMTVLVLGCVMYAFGGRILPAIGDAGQTTKTRIDQAFQS